MLYEVITMPPLRIRLGLTPKKAGFHTTRSASLPTSTEPTRWLMPWLMAGLMVYFVITSYSIHYTKLYDKTAGVRYRRPYQTRHTYASMMLSAGEHTMHVSSQMGHADWTMLIKVYAQWMPHAAEIPSYNFV